MNMVFDERYLRSDIVKVWGEYGAHAEVFDGIMAVNAEMVEALRDLLVCMDLANWHDDPSAIKARAVIAKSTGREV